MPIAFKFCPNSMLTTLHNHPKPVVFGAPALPIIHAPDQLSSYAPVKRCSWLPEYWCGPVGNWLAAALITELSRRAAGGHRQRRRRRLAVGGAHRQSRLICKLIRDQRLAPAYPRAHSGHAA